MNLFQKAKKVLNNERGAYGAVELMAIVAVVIVVSLAVTGKLSDGDSGLPNAADTAVSTINEQILDATGASDE
ncbi:hypothetical protein ASZ90_017301 [hydrocarbon metagenome]|uniref:Uncharacterized protein n=1 Tax=hydrocarbon metagenome TaxID=938273 RepID=A0A0W8E9T1_9ZZZZ